MKQIYKKSQDVAGHLTPPLWQRAHKYSQQ